MFTTEVEAAAKELHTIAEPKMLGGSILLSDLLSLAGDAGHSADDVRDVMQRAQYDWLHLERSRGQIVVCFPNFDYDSVTVAEAFGGINQ